MKIKTIFLSCALGLGMTTATWADWTAGTSIDLSNSEEEIVQSLHAPVNPIKTNDSDLESKGFGEEGKGWDEIVQDMSSEDLNEMPKISIHFDTDSTVIHSNDGDLLRKLANVFKEKLSSAKIVVAGHTDSDGSSRHNIGLSYERAQAVKNFLISQGVRENHLTIRAFGEDQPVASNSSNFGKAQNRRVEFIRVQ